MDRHKVLTKHLKAHDRELYCAKNNNHILCVYRNGYRSEVYDVDGHTIVYNRPSPHYIFALTDTWSTNGKSVDWGIEPILARIKAGDLWNNPKFVEDLIASYELDEKTREKDQRNNIESFLLDFRRQFAKTFSDVNTSTIKKKDRRFADEKKIKQTI